MDLSCLLKGVLALRPGVDEGQWSLGAFVRQTAIHGGLSVLLPVLVGLVPFASLMSFQQTQQDLAALASFLFLGV
jgi:hypothetical protein